MKVIHIIFQVYLLPLSFLLPTSAAWNSPGNIISLLLCAFSICVFIQVLWKKYKTKFPYW